MGKIMAQSALFGVLTWLASFLALPLGPVPVTAQTLVVLLAGLLLPPKAAALSMVVHLVLRLLTLGGALFLQPSFGFVLAFCVVAPAVACAARPHPTPRKKLAWVLLWATLAFYLIGLPYMAWILNGVLGKNKTLGQLLEIGMLLFLPGDALKALVVYAVTPRLQHAVQAPRDPETL